MTFAGRLGTDHYLDMDVTIGEAPTAAEALAASLGNGEAPQPLYVDPR